MTADKASIHSRVSWLSISPPNPKGKDVALFCAVLVIASPAGVVLVAYRMKILAQKPLNFK
jgi:hypothetical protein